MAVTFPWLFSLRSLNRLSSSRRKVTVCREIWRRRGLTHQTVMLLIFPEDFRIYGGNQKCVLSWADTTHTRIKPDLNHKLVELG